MHDIKCKQCGKDFVDANKSRKYCSQECYHDFKKQVGLDCHKHLRKGKCRDCGEVILAKRAYCDKCYQAFLDKPRKRYKMTTNINCSKCGIEKTKDNTFSPEEGLWSTKCRECCKQSRKKSEVKIKQECVDYKGGKCQKCGYKKCLQALHFHHLDPTKKDFHISKKRGSELTLEIYEELDKCILLCANCHMEEHDRLSNGKLTKPKNTNKESVSEFNARVAAELCC